MYSTFSFSAKPCNGANNCRLLCPKSMVRKTKAEVITAPKQSTKHAFPQLLKQGIPGTDLHVHEIVQRQSQANNLAEQNSCRKPEFHPMFLEEAYEKCKNICAEYAKTFYLGLTNTPFSVVHDWCMNPTASNLRIITKLTTQISLIFFNICIPFYSIFFVSVLKFQLCHQICLYAFHLQHKMLD